MYIQGKMNQKENKSKGKQKELTSTAAVDPQHLKVEVAH